MSIVRLPAKNGLFQAVMLTLTFSIGACLIGPLGVDQHDPLSLWLIKLVQTNLPSAERINPLEIRSTPTPVAVLEWGFCLLAGIMAVLISKRLKLRWCLTAAGTLAVFVMGITLFTWRNWGFLISSGVPLLGIGFGLWTVFILRRPITVRGPEPLNNNPIDGHEHYDVDPMAKPPGSAEALQTNGDFFNPSACLDAAPEDESESGFINGRVIGRYEIIRSIGKGAMGEVFLGRDPHINRLTAVKTVRFEDSFAEDDIEQIKGKFFREAESAGTLSHPHIVTIYDAGENGDCAYIAMEFLEGSTLLRFARRQRLLPLRRIIRYMAQVAEGLDYAHRQGITHRDIKPANIMLVQNGKIKITDFGIAHIATSSQTQTGVVKGTPYYMSPEQFSGQKVDGRSDIFSLGTTMFQLLTGTLPFYAESPALLMNQIMNFPHPNPRAINPRVLPAMVKIVDKALEKDRANRYQSAKSLARDLRRLDQRIKTALQKDRTANL